MTVYIGRPKAEQAASEAKLETIPEVMRNRTTSTGASWDGAELVRSLRDSAGAGAPRSPRRRQKVGTWGFRALVGRR